MNAFVEWFTPDLLRTLGLSLLHFLWQGAALAAFSAAAFALVRNPSARYALGVLTMVLMLAAPVLTFLTIRDIAPNARATAMQLAVTPGNNRL
jgi:hypothetical protein